MIKLISVCETHDLSWFPGFGSLLGAVRDHKIIPCDDSIDVVMPYSDYNKLMNLTEEVWGNGLFLQTYYTDPQYPRYYARLRDNRITLIKAEYTSYDMNLGIYINIMPLVNFADHAGARKKQLRADAECKALTKRDPKCIPHIFWRIFVSPRLLSTENRIQKLRESAKARIFSAENEKTADYKRKTNCV